MFVFQWSILPNHSSRAHSIRTGSDLFLKVVKKPWIIKKGKSLKNFAHTNELKDVGGRNAAAAAFSPSIKSTVDYKLNKK